MIIKASFSVEPFNQSNETEQMKRSELYYREPRNEPFQPRSRTTQPKGSLNEDVEQRIVTLYTSGQSIESITREVGRARHLVVHILQSRGVFGNRGMEPDRVESRTESDAVEELEEQLVAEDQLELQVVTDKTPEAQVAVKEPSRKMTRLRKSKAPEQLKSVTIEKPKARLPAAGKAQVSGRWSPPVVDALLKVVAQSEIDPEMSMEEVMRMLSGAKRKAG
jgi:hypothetical protein